MVLSKPGPAPDRFAPPPPPDAAPGAHRQRLAAAQGQLEAAKATRAALEGQLARVTELVQAERRAFAERLAEEVAQTEARLAEALAGEHRLKVPLPAMCKLCAPSSVLC